MAGNPTKNYIRVASLLVKTKFSKRESW